MAVSLRRVSFLLLASGDVFRGDVALEADAFVAEQPVGMVRRGGVGADAAVEIANGLVGAARDTVAPQASLDTAPQPFEPPAARIG